MKEWILSFTERLYLRLAQTYGPDFVTLHKRPRAAHRVGTWSDPSPRTDSVAIVMQGPLLVTHDFTLETARLYKKHFPDAQVIVSTWEGEPETSIESLRHEGVTVLINAKPERPGTSHINYQIVSTRRGIDCAAAAGAHYVLKTRTDQRLYAPNALLFLLDLIHTFPVARGYRQKKRIVVSSFTTFKYRLYSPTDMLVFGTVEDMRTYWNAPLEMTEQKLAQARSIREWVHLEACEVYLAKHFLEQVGRVLAWTLLDSWQAYADHFCIADAEALDTYWPKYDAHREYRHRFYDGIRSSQLLDFREWLRLHDHREDLRAPEDVLDEAFGSRVSYPVQ